MTQHAHHAARYSAVVALAGALLAPGVTTPATALEDPGQTPDATPAQAGNNVQAQDPAVKVPGEGNERMPQGKVEQPAAKANDTATVAGSTVIKNGQGLEISGSGWGANAVIAVKYDDGNVKPTEPVTHDGKDLSARGVVAVIHADADGNFTETLPFPTNANWTVGSEHKINFLSGSLQKGDQKHSATHTVTVGEEAPAAEAPKAEETPKEETPEQPQVKETPKNETPAEAPKAEETPAQQPQTDEAAKNEAEQRPKAEEKPAPELPKADEQQPTDPSNQQIVKANGATITGAKVINNGQNIVVSGTGWISGDGTGSVIAVKYDGGKVIPLNPVMYDGKNLAGRGVVAIIEADTNGNFTATLPYPSHANWAVNSHHQITFLAGSLKKDDVTRSATLDITVGDVNGHYEYQPANDVNNINASLLTEVDRHGASVSLDGRRVFAYLPEAEPGTYVRVTPYLGDSSQSLYASPWLRVDTNHYVSYDLPSDLPAASYRFVVQSGNQDNFGAVLGWDDVVITKPISMDTGNISAAGGYYDAGSNNSGSGYGSVAPIPTQSSGGNFTVRHSSVTKQASLGTTAELANDTLINRVQARAKAAAKNGSNGGAHAKSAPKKTHTAKAAPGKNGTQGNATTAATQSDSNSAPNIIGAELSGFSRWFANNANNVLLSIAGLIILVLALTFRKRA